MTHRFTALALLGLLACAAPVLARPHGMHDKGGDPLVIVRRSSLPPDARESRAMQGRKR